MADRTAAQHLVGEAQAIRAPLVGAVVRQAGQELADQAVLPRVHLDPVAATVDRQAGGGREPVDHGGDVLGFHPLRDLPGVHLGNPRRCPQLPLRVRR